jgi:TatD DNase family protein
MSEMGLIDTHTHLESFERRGVLGETLTRARTAGLDALITIGTSPDDWSLYRGLARSDPQRIFYTVGLHPCSVEADWETAVGDVELFWQVNSAAGETRPVALGEIGLDRFHLPKNDPAASETIFSRQRAAFVESLAIAKRLNCPVVIHSRGAFAECVELIDASGVNWSQVIFHCFTEGPEQVAALVERRAWASFTGIVTYNSAEAVRAAAKLQGIERLMIETDAPYLTPVPHRGKPNEPAYLRHTAEYLAANVFGLSLDELTRITTANARRVFGL